MIGYENVDEQKLFKLFCSNEYCIGKPLFKDNKVFATNGKIAIYVNAEICQCAYEKTERFNIELPPVEQELEIPLLNLQKAYDSLPKVEQVEYDMEDCNECDGTGTVEWEYIDKKGDIHHKDFDCPACDGYSFLKRNIRKVYGPDKSAVIKLDGFFLLHKQIKAIIDTLFLLGKDHITLLSKNRKYVTVLAYFRIDENITIVASPCLFHLEKRTEAEVEL